MKVFMTGREIALLEAFLTSSRHYLEFGTGGSTILAAEHVAQSVISVDSSTKWLANVRDAIPLTVLPKVTLKYEDIGTTREWGYPSDSTSRPKWQSYSTSVWEHPLSQNVDLFLIDGRFRVACFCEAVIHAPFGSVILIHDSERPSYQVVKTIIRQIAAIDNLSAFIKDATSLVGRAKELADEHRLDPE